MEIIASQIVNDVESLHQLEVILMSNNEVILQGHNLNNDSYMTFNNVYCKTREEAWSIYFEWVDHYGEK